MCSGDETTHACELSLKTWPSPNRWQGASGPPREAKGLEGFGLRGIRHGGIPALKNGLGEGETSGDLHLW